MENLNYRQWGAVGITLFLGLGLTLAGFLLAGELERGRALANLESNAADYQNHLQREVDGAIQAVRAIGALYDSSQYVSRNEFKKFAKQVLRFGHGVQALQWVPRVPHDKRVSMVATARQFGLTNFRITELNTQGRLQPAGSKEIYYPIYFVEPLRDNEAALGLDVGSMPKWLAALELARDTGRMIASEPIRLLQGYREQPNGVAIFQPIYEYGAKPDTEENRREKLRGFVGGVFHVGDLAKAASAGIRQAGIDFTIYHSAGEGKPIRFYYHSTPGPDKNSASSGAGELRPHPGESVRFIQVAQRRWKVVFTPARRLWEENASNMPRVVLAAGITATLILFFSVLGLIRKGVSLDLANKKLAEDIQERKRVADERALIADIAHLVNNTGDRSSLLKAVLVRLKAWSGCEAVGIRLREGNDFPYFVTKGFSENFVEQESRLFGLGKDGEMSCSDGQNQILECMCGNILQGRLDSTRSLFTNGGSFWSRRAADMESVAKKSDRKIRVRGRCTREGYESIALIPLRAGGETFGLIQLNDRRKSCFTEENVALVERIANNISIALAKFKADEERKRIRRQWKLALDAANMGWWHYDPILNISSWNERFAEIMQLSGTGGSPEEAFQRVHPEDLPLIRDMACAALDPHNTGLYLADYRVILTDGSTRWLESHGLASFEGEDENRQAVSFAGTIQDITERKLAMDRLARSEEQLRAAFENAPEGMALLDGERRFTKVNPRLCEIMGYSEEELLGKSFNRFTHPEDRQAGRDRWKELFSGKETASRDEKRLLHKNGDVIWAMVGNAVLHSDEGEVRHVISHINDITERKKAEQARQEAVLRQNEAVRAGNVGLWGWDLLTNDAHFSSEWKSQIGYEAHEIIDGFAQWESRVHPDDLEPVLGQIRQLIDSVRSRGKWEFRFRHKDGYYLWIMAQASVLRDESGRAVRMLGSHVDITERKQTEQALRLSEQKFAAVFRHTPMWVAITTVEEGYFLDVNETFLKVTGYARDEVIGRTIMDLDLRADPDEREKVVRLLKYEGSVRNMEVKRKLRSGEIRDMLYSAEMLPMPGEKAMVAVLADITEMKKAQQEKDDLEAQLRQARKMESIGTLAGGIAHDFNNILSAIMGYGELLQLSTPSDSKNRSYVKHILAAADRAKKLVIQILAFSRKAKTEAKPVDLNSRVKDAVELIRRTIPRMISVELNMAKDLLPISADPGQLEQIVLNLASNAKDAMPTGGKLLFETGNSFLDEEYCRDHFEAEPGHYVRLEVSDTGQGMPKELQDQIFDPFFTTKEVGRGTGLGLSTVYGIVKAHKGVIYCYSEPGQGTTFRIYFPALKQNQAAEQRVPEAYGNEVIGGDETLLVVDDEEALLELGGQLFSLEGYRVLIAKSGEEALEIYRRQMEEIDLVVLDVSMPGMGGRKCLSEILKLNSQAKVLIASGYSANGQLKDILAAGASGYIAKPFERIKMLRKVREVLDTPGPE